MEMKVTDLPKGVTLYELAKVLGITAPAAYKYKKNDKIPDLRVYQLKELKPEWFNEQGK
jgi:predicted transcriptional regulator